jgi:hypothetical protein
VTRPRSSESMSPRQPRAIGTLLAAAIACSGDPTAVNAVYLELSIIDRFAGNVLRK